MLFHCLKYSESISIKTKAFWEVFFTNLLRTKSSTNSVNFIKILCPFCMHVWNPKGEPLRKMDFFTVSNFKKLKVARWTNYISIWTTASTSPHYYPICCQILLSSEMLTTICDFFTICDYRATDCIGLFPIRNTLKIWFLYFLDRH